MSLKPCEVFYQVKYLADEVRNLLMKRIATFVLALTILRGMVPLSDGYRSQLCQSQLINRRENRGFTVPSWAGWADQRRAQWSQDYASTQNQMNAASRFNRCMDQPHVAARLRLNRWIPFVDDPRTKVSSPRGVGIVREQRRSRGTYNSDAVR